MSEEERKTENPTSRVAFVSRCVLIFFGLFFIAVGASALYLLKGDSFWFVCSFIVAGFCYISVASFASDRVVCAFTIFYP